MNRLDFLDAGRGIAILGVIAVHTVHNFRTGTYFLDMAISMGQFGVQLFYIISAYTMCHTLESRKHNEIHHTQNFLIRRFLRLMPPFWAAILLYLGFYFADTHYFASTDVNAFSVITSIFLLHGFWPTSFSVIVPGGGSIATEAQFYLLFPAIFLLPKNFKSIAIFGILMMALEKLVIGPGYLQLFSLANLRLGKNEIHQFFHFYIFNQLSVFLIGILLYIKDREARLSKMTKIDLIWVIMFVGCFFTFAPAMAAIGLIGAALLEALKRMSSKFPKAVTWLGGRSYSLYLFHFAAINILLLIIGSRPSSKSIFAFSLSYAIVILLSVAISFMTKPLLEDFGSSLGRKLVKLNEFRRK